LRDHTIRLDELMPLIRERLDAGESVRFSPHGTSMLPMLKDGRDQVILSPLTDKLKKYDLPLYQRENGQYVLHRIVRAKDDYYTCMGDNQFVPEKGLRHDQMIAVVTSFVYRGKEYSTECLGYKAYCCFWYAVRPLRHLFMRVRRCLAKIKRRITNHYLQDHRQIRG